MTLALAEQTGFVEAEAVAFMERTAGQINSGAVAVMMSIGHRTGLFDVMARLHASTSERIATEAGLAERYVREWLAVMVTGGVVIYDPASRCYGLPAEHAACLTRGAPLGNLAVYAQTIALLGAVEPKILECFRTGEGTSYADYPCFHQIMAEDSEQTVVAPLFDSILPLAPSLAVKLEHGIDVLDAGCGRGMALIEMAARYPRSRFTGYDLCADAIAHARETVTTRELANVRFDACDLTHLDEVEAYDLVLSFDAIHDQKTPQDLIIRLFRALRPGGTYLVQDIGGSAALERNLDFPMAALLYAISCAHCTPVSVGQGGEGLGTMWGWETAIEMLEVAGFSGIEKTVLPHDPMNVWFVAGKPPA